MPRSKTKTILNHARTRGWSRFGLRSKDIDAITRMVQQGKGELHERQSNRVAIHKLTYNGMAMLVVYDSLRSVIVTFLHPDGNPLDWTVPGSALAFTAV